MLGFLQCSGWSLIRNQSYAGQTWHNRKARQPLLEVYSSRYRHCSQQQGNATCPLTSVGNRAFHILPTHRQANVKRPFFKDTTCSSSQQRSPCTLVRLTLGQLQPAQHESPYFVGVTDHGLFRVYPCEHGRLG